MGRQTISFKKSDMFKNDSTLYHLWAVWDRNYVGEPIITWHLKKDATLPLFPEEVFCDA